MDHLLCIRILSDMGETEQNFLQRLESFWSMLQIEHDEIFKCLYAESSYFEEVENRSARLYLIEQSQIESLQQELEKAGFDSLSPDEDELYTSYEATPPEWILIRD